MAGPILTPPHYDLVPNVTYQLGKHCRNLKCHQPFESSELVARVKCCRADFHERCIQNATECPISTCHHKFKPTPALDALNDLLKDRDSGGGSDEEKQQVLPNLRTALFEAKNSSTCSTTSALNRPPHPKPPSQNAIDAQTRSYILPIIITITVIIAISAIAFKFLGSKQA